jgi:hypothetical protein
VQAQVAREPQQRRQWHPAGDRAHAVVEDAVEVAAHEQMPRQLAEPPERERVAHAVTDHDRAFARRLERVRVLPQRVGPAQLHVDEALRRLPDLDPASASASARPCRRSRYSISARAASRSRRASCTRKRSHGGVIASRL